MPGNGYRSQLEFARDTTPRAGNAGAVLARHNLGRSAYDTQRILRSPVQAMKLSYYPDTDSLYIDLTEQPSVESEEISEGVVLDYDAAGNLVGIDIDNASQKVQLDRL